MDLLFLTQSNSNTVLNMPDGRPLYHVDSPFQMFGRTTNISRLDGRGGSNEVGVVELHGMSPDVVAVWGRDVTPEKQGIFSSARTFCASNGQIYTWKALDSGSVALTDANKQAMAIYDSGSSGFFGKARPAKLSIMPPGMAIMDEIVATYLYVAQKKEQAKRRKNHNRHHHMAGGGGGTGFGAGGGGGGIGGSSSM